MRHFDDKPYSADEARVAKFLSDHVDVGGGDDPIGFILSSYEYLIEQRKQLSNDAADHDRSFDLRWKADMRAIKRWQAAHPGNDNVWPDRADLCVWLMEQHDRKQTALQTIANRDPDRPDQHIQWAVAVATRGAEDGP